MKRTLRQDCLRYAKAQGYDIESKKTNGGIAAVIEGKVYCFETWQHVYSALMTAMLKRED